jgi:hypothetical protein
LRLSPGDARECTLPLPSSSAQVELRYDTLFDVTENTGNKPVWGTGLQRLHRFNNWAHSQSEDVIICAGHSLWFRHFFRSYLPASTDVELAQQAKDYKMMNGGAVGFDLHVRRKARPRVAHSFLSCVCW